MPELEALLDSLDFDYYLHCQGGQYEAWDAYGLGSGRHLTPADALNTLLARRQERSRWLRRFLHRKKPEGTDDTRRSRRRVT